MYWLELVAYFVAGLFAANGVPHFVNGISGNRFQTPFAKPPGVGESSAFVNVLWGFSNFVIAFILLFAVGDFETGFSLDMLAFAVGVLAAGAGLALYFTKIRKPATSANNDKNSNKTDKA